MVYQNWIAKSEQFHHKPPERRQHRIHVWQPEIGDNTISGHNLTRVDGFICLYSNICNKYEHRNSVDVLNMTYCVLAQIPVDTNRQKAADFVVEAISFSIE